VLAVLRDVLGWPVGPEVLRADAPWWEEVGRAPAAMTCLGDVAHGVHPGHGPHVAALVDARTPTVVTASLRRGVYGHPARWLRRYDDLRIFRLIREVPAWA